MIFSVFFQVHIEKVPRVRVLPLLLIKSFPINNSLVFPNFDTRPLQCWLVLASLNEE
jgi:hypothetical protein